MEKQFIQFNARSASNPDEFAITIIDVGTIEALTNDRDHPGCMNVHVGNGTYSTTESLEYFQNLLKPLGWEQK